MAKQSGDGQKSNKRQEWLRQLYEAEFFDSSYGLRPKRSAYVRYADNGNIYVKSARAGHLVMSSVTQFLEKCLRLRVNTAKSAVALVNKRKKYWSIVTWLMNLGVNERDARTIGLSGKGWWRLAKTPILHRELNKE
ncbi:MAG: hypothetical protein CMF38_04340 [Legionellaceae bacterium]|nr:hypothetical protein [Legionellaceae bacterium]HAF87178.1 hypothetical protein [Legionellales bacterium]|tara:strand:- start:213 stop:620 length:408 start_codon:yes stop_codon:yes gene_type:complete